MGALCCLGVKGSGQGMTIKGFVSRAYISLVMTARECDVKYC